MKKTYLVLITAIVLLGCSTPQVTTNPGTGQSQTNYVVDPKLTATLGTIGAINAASSPLNPFSGLVEIGLGAAALIAAWLAKRKNDSLNSSNSQLKAVIQGVEAAGTPELKQAIQDHATRVGVEGDLNTTVQRVGNGNF